MKDRSLGIWLMVIFGVSGVAAITLAWSSTAFLPDRLSATLVGAGGVLVAVIRGLMLRKQRTGFGEELTAEVPADDEN